MSGLETESLSKRLGLGLSDDFGEPLKREDGIKHEEEEEL